MHSRSIFLSFALLLQPLNASFLERVEPFKPVVFTPGPTEYAVNLPRADKEQLVKDYLAADHRIIILDNGGVLMPSNLPARSPEERQAAQAADAVLEQVIGSSEKNVIAINSARSSDIYYRFHYPGRKLYVAGNMGSDAVLVTPEAASKIEDTVHQIPELEFLFAQIEEIKTPVRQLLDKLNWQSETAMKLKPSIIVWYKKDSAESKKKFERGVNKILKSFPDYQITQPFSDKKMFSIAHKLAHKGTFTQWLLKQYEGKKVFALTIGDQAPDEEMHKVMQHFNHHSIIIKDQEEQMILPDEKKVQTHASLRFDNVEDVHDILKAFATADNA